MNKQDILLLWAEKHIYYKKGYIAKHYPPIVCHIMNMFDERVRAHEKTKDYLCEWGTPYGFVPEAGCPLHG